MLGGGRKHFLPNTTSDVEYPEEKGSRTDGVNLIDVSMSNFLHQCTDVMIQVVVSYYRA